MVNLKGQPQAIESFFSFCKKRHSLYLNKEVFKKEYPWSDDPILNEYRFTNVYRELDKGTQYYINKIANNNRLGNQQLLYFTVAYRLCNDIDNFEIVYPTLFKNIIDLKVYHEMHDNVLKSVAKNGRFFNSAYCVFTGMKRGDDKYHEYCKLLTWVSENIDWLTSQLESSETAEQAYKVIQKIPYTGTFIAYEIYSDLLYTKLLNKFSENEFVNIGVGAIDGINIIFGTEFKKWHQKQALPYFLKLWGCQDEYWEFDKLTWRNIEHSLCEYRKYHNIKYHGRGANGGGRKYKLNK